LDRVLEAQRAEPAAIQTLPPRSAVDESLAHQHLVEPMTAAEHVMLGRFPGTLQVTCRFILGLRRDHLLQEPRAKQFRELAGIAAVCLDPIPGSDWNQR